jgi:polysaccharide pyruvyl transferase CsaB
MKKNPRLFVVGYYGFHNLGDEAILSSMLVGVRAVASGAEFVVTSGDPESTKALHGIESIHWRDIPAILREVRASDLVILGGGGLFLDFWGYAGETLLTRDHWGLPFFAGPAVIAALEAKPLLLYSVGVESLTNEMARATTKAIFDLGWAATVRDEVSAEIVSQLGIDMSRIRVTADPVFELALRDPAATGIKAAKSDSGQPGEGPQIGVALRSWSVGVDPDYWIGEVAAALDAFITRHQGRVLLIPFQTLEGESEYDDRDVSKSVASLIPDQDHVEVSEAPVDARDAAALFGTCDVVLGMRYHAVLLAAVAGSPTVALKYAPKVGGLMDQLGIRRFGLAMEEIERGEIDRLLEEAWRSRAQLASDIETASKRLATEGEENNRIVHDLLSGGVCAPGLTAEARALVAGGAEAAVLNAEERTSEALALAQQRDGLLEQRDGLKGERDQLLGEREALSGEREALIEERDGLIGERNALTGERDALTGERDALTGERDALTGERDALAAERNSLIGERDLLVQQRDRLEEEKADLDQRHGELEHVHGDLKELFDRITSTRSYRMMSAVWTVRGGLAKVAGSVRRAPHRLLRRGKEARTDSPRKEKLQSWDGFLLDRHKRELMARFGTGLVGRRAREAGGETSVIVLVGDDCSGLADTIASVLSGSHHVSEIVVGCANPSIVQEPSFVQATQSGQRIRVASDGCENVAEVFWDAIGRSRGEFITWLWSGDIVEPGALEAMAHELEKNSRCGAVSSAVELGVRAVGGSELSVEEGGGEVDSHRGGGREADLAVFNIRPPCDPALILMCRRLVFDLLEGPGELWKECFFSDLVMRINELFIIGRMPPKARPGARRHRRADDSDRGQGPATATELERMAVFDDFRRNLLLGPVLWRVECAGQEGRQLADALRAGAADAGDLIIADGERLLPVPEARSWLPCVAVTVVGGDSADVIPGDADHSTVKVLVADRVLEGELPPGWDLAIALSPSSHTAGGSREPGNWWVVSGIGELVKLVDMTTMNRRLNLFERRVVTRSRGETSIDASVVVCTHQAIPPLARALASVAAQDFDFDSFEVVLVNNNPENSELRAALDEVIEEHFTGGEVELREVPCPVKGLSAARNVGIAAARGEVLLFLDDDAVAPSTWVAEAVRLFKQHPEAGIIGGHIRLIPPIPRPAVLQPGWGRYWSEFIPDDSGFHFVEEWWDYPWGASWCGRRSVLLEIGGFRSRFGRTRGDFAGGEEVVAAALAQRLGWKIALAPELAVEHHVVADRYSWRHVRKTIRAGTLGNYRAQREMYIPMESIRWTLRCLLSPGADRTVGADSVMARLRHWSYRKAAWTRLLAWQLADQCRRWRRPVLNRRCS